MKESIASLRLQIDGLAQLTKSLKPISIHPKLTVIGSKAPVAYTSSDEIDDCVHSLLYAKAWLGKALGSLGEETPYKNDGNRSKVEDIEPTADKLNMDFDAFPNLNHIQKVDQLREEIGKTIKEISQIGAFPCALIVGQYLTEARFALGFELERIRNNEIKNK